MIFFQTKLIVVLNVFAMERQRYSPLALAFAKNTTMDRTIIKRNSPWNCFQYFREHPDTQSVTTATQTDIKHLTRVLKITSHTKLNSDPINKEKYHLSTGHTYKQGYNIKQSPK